MKYLLDTCIISYFFKALPAVLENFQARSPGDLAMSSITFMEIEFGLELNSARAKKLRPKWLALSSIIHVLPFESEDAIIAGTLRSKLQKGGNTIGAYDVLIAATALRHNLICVTNNTREFERIMELKIENWMETTLA